MQSEILKTFLPTLNYITEFKKIKNQHTASTSSGLFNIQSTCGWLCIWVCVSYSILSPEGLAVVVLGGLCRGRSCVEQQHRKRVKALRANWNQMSEATGRGILTVEQECQRGKRTSPWLFCCLSLSLYLWIFYLWVVCFFLSVETTWCISCLGLRQLKDSITRDEYNSHEKEDILFCCCFFPLHFSTPCVILCENQIQKKI